MKKLKKKKLKKKQKHKTPTFRVAGRLNQVKTNS